MWSINAARKKDGDVIPGTSKWIRSEALELHDQMFTDLEQIAYDVAADFAWIDEQMKEILESNELNPRLLLESPIKLRAKDSPVKQIRNEALATLKSPLKPKVGEDLSKSPIRARPRLNLDSKLVSPLNFRLFQSPSGKKNNNLETEHSFIKSSTPITKKPQSVNGSDEHDYKSSINTTDKPQQHSQIQPQEAPIFCSTPESNLQSHNLEPSIIQTKTSASLVKTPDRLVSPISSKKDKESEQTSLPAIESTVASAPPLSSDLYTNYVPIKELPAKPNSTAQSDFIDVNDNSLQAIRAAIRKNMMRKSSKASVAAPSDSESSYRSAMGDKSQELSKGSVAEKLHHDEIPTSASTFQPSKTGVSTSTVNASFKDDDPMHSTPVKSKYSQRESQGFGLMSHNLGALSVKTIKKTESDQIKQPLSKESLSFKEKSTSPTVFSKSLFPTTSNGSAPSSNPTLNLSPLSKFKNEAAKSSDNPIKLKRSSTELIKTGATDLSPVRNNTSTSQKLSFSPLSNLFASVGTALRSVGRTKKPITGLTDDQDEEVDHRPTKRPMFANVSRNIDFLEATGPKSPQKFKNTIPGVKRSAIFSDLEDIFQTKIAAKGASQDTGSNRNQAGQPATVLTDSDNEDGDVFRQSVMKLSPVRSIWGPPMRNTMGVNKQSEVLNSPVKKSPARPAPTRVSDTKFVSGLKSKMPLVPPPPISHQNQPPQPQVLRSLTRVSLSTHSSTEQRSNQPLRKSYIKTGGLTSVPLDVKTKARTSYTVNSDHLFPNKKAHIEEPHQHQQLQTSRKLTKVPLSTSNQQAHYQKGPVDIKRRSLELPQGMLSKKAGRISQEPVLPEYKEVRLLKSKLTSKNLMSSSLTKTALPTASNDLNKDKRISGTKISSNLATSNANKMLTSNSTSPPQAGIQEKSKSKEPVVLPEIFSGSEAEDDNSVLMSWAESPYLRQQLQLQQRTMDPDKVFGELPPLDMEEIFGNSTRIGKLQKRGSSAKWTR